MVTTPIGGLRRAARALAAASYEANGINEQIYGIRIQIYAITCNHVAPVNRGKGEGRGHAEQHIWVGAI